MRGMLGSADEFRASSLRSLDWPRVIEALVERAATAVGREVCAEPELMDEPDDVRLWLRRVTQLREVLEEDYLPLGGIGDIRAHVTRCSKGEVLDGRLLTEVADALAGLMALRRFVVERAEEAPDLQPLAEGIVPLPELQSRLSASFDRQGELSTVTYPHLADLRSAKARLHEAIRGQLEDLTTTDEWQGALQEDYLTVRNDRYVVPVKVQAKSMDLGIVHDTSNTGQTIFVEPREVVGLNNRLKMADAELWREEQSILASLCESVAVWGHDIRDSLALAAELDAIHARVRVARDLDASEPTVVDRPLVDLRSARHPLLVLKGADVVANDLRLDSERCALVLSGPNAGGKTITLKTLGLCACMVRAGMHLPAEAGSRIGMFGQVLTDIGDAQSVQEDLSTFSGHLLAVRRILEVLQESSDDALVLIDEIAVGTDPQQGAALAAAVLRAVVERGAMVAATTHFSPLKALPEVDARFVNGRLEFDPERMMPSYRLTVGNPGRSYAFDIARQLGLPGEVLADAEARVEPTHREVEALLASLERERAQVRSEADRLADARDEAARQKAELERRLAAIERRERDLREEVVEAFDEEVEGYREVVRGIIRELQRKPSLTAADRARRRIATGATRAKEKLDLRPRDDTVRIDWSAAKVGDRVTLLAGGREGTLASLPDTRGRVEVTVGAARVRCKQRELGPPGQPRKGPPRVPDGWRGSPGDPIEADIEKAVRTPDNTLDLRGERVDDALEMVDRFLDDASMQGRSVVFVLHGHGTGALRKAVREHLRGSAYVQESRPATRSQGGDALTAVRL